MLSVARRHLRSTTRHLLCLLRFTVSALVDADRLFLRLALRSGRETLCSEVSGLEPLLDNDPGQLRTPIKEVFVFQAPVHLVH